MATTAAGTPYVESSDLVANYPGVSLALANHIDTIGKVLQVVKGTDVTARTTSSTSFVDASISVTITPQKIDSEIILIWSLSFNHLTTANYAKWQITDNTNNTLNGAQSVLAGSSTTSEFIGGQTLFAYDNPATLSATTYKGRFAVNASGTNRLDNNLSTGQLYAIEVAA